METLTDRIRQIVDEQFGTQGVYLLDVTVKNHGGVARITVIAETDTGIGIDECVAITRAINKDIETHAWVENHSLEVTSPGLDRPLELPRQYTRQIGRKLMVQKNDGSVLEGKLSETDNEKIVLMVSAKPKLPAKPVEIRFDEIKKTNVVVAFN